MRPRGARWTKPRSITTTARWRGYLHSGSSDLWRVLTPGRTLQVRLTAMPLFFYLDEHGAAQLAYAIGHNQHFAGKTVESPIYTLSLTQEGEVLIDGARAPQPAPPQDTGPALPDGYEDGPLGAWVKERRLAAGMSQEALGRAAGEPWTRPEGDPTDPDVWIELLEISYLMPNREQADGIARALSIDAGKFWNLVKRGW